MPATRDDALSVERIQTGVRLEKRLLKVTKALADSLDLTLGDLLEGVLLHALEGKPPFGQATLARAAQLKQVFGLDLTAAHSHRLSERPAAAPRAEAHMSTARCHRRAHRRRTTPSSQAFRAGTLANDAFHHRDHVRMAWLYVRTHGPAHAVTRFIDDLRAFAAAKGVPRLYHATITTAYLTLVAERMAAGPEGPWEAFAAAHGDLLRWKPSVLDGYYSADRLWSDLARRQFLMPDLAPLPPHAEPRRQCSRPRRTGPRRAGRPIGPAAVDRAGPTASSCRAMRLLPALAVLADARRPADRRRRRPDDRGRTPAPAGALRADRGVAGLGAGRAVGRPARRSACPPTRGASATSSSTWRSPSRSTWKQLEDSMARPLPATAYTPQATDAGILWYGIDRGNRQRTGEARVPDGRFKTAADGPRGVRQAARHDDGAGQDQPPTTSAAVR